MTSSLIPGHFTYMAWSVAPRLLGPFMLASTRRTDAAQALVAIARDLEAFDSVDRVRVLQTTFIAPVSGHPRYDLVMLARGKRALDDDALTLLSAAGLLSPDVIATAQNVARFGDTEAVDGDILLNHFAGDAPAADAVQAWSSASKWYTNVLHVDNSTLLQFDQPGPYLLVNYARIPTRVPHFMVGQLLRPSFYRTVISALQAANIRSYPVFLREVRP